MTFNQNIIIIGFGVVAKALFPLLLRNLKVTPSQCVVIDFADRWDALSPWLGQGLRFVRERVSPQSLDRLLKEHAAPGDLIIDLAWSVDFFAISRWAQEHGVLYVNASLESWPTEGTQPTRPGEEHSLYSCYAKLSQLKEERRGTCTALVDQGANPGLISHFVKAGLLDIASRVLWEKCPPRDQRSRLEKLCEAEDFPRLARELGVKVIHCSERDTQECERPRDEEEFVSTWCAEGMWDEAVSPAELGWGTHELSLPEGALVPSKGPANQLLLPSKGMHTLVRSWVPYQEITGRLVCHGEAYSLSQALSVHEEGELVYRPTVNYAYLPNADAVASLESLPGRGYKLHSKLRIPTQEIISGSDTLGALIMGHPFGAWWTGSMLTIGDARMTSPETNATAVQVAAGLMAAITWAVLHPKEGLCLPEDLPHHPFLSIARPYLGQWISMPSSWTPAFGREAWSGDLWQFHNFIDNNEVNAPFAEAQIAEV